MHHLSSLFSHFQGKVGLRHLHPLIKSKQFSHCSFKQCQNTCVNVLVFIFFSAVSNRFKYQQNACFRDNVCKILNRFKYRQNACFETLFSCFLSNYKYRQNACLETLFSCFLSNYKSFQTVSDCTLYLAFKHSKVNLKIVQLV